MAPSFPDVVPAEETLSHQLPAASAETIRGREGSIKAALHEAWIQLCPWPCLLAFTTHEIFMALLFA